MREKFFKNGVDIQNEQSIIKIVKESQSQKSKRQKDTDRETGLLLTIDEVDKQDYRK